MSDPSPSPDRGWRQFYRVEDWWACWVGFLVLLVAVAGVAGKVPKVGGWVGDPLDGFRHLKTSVALELPAADAATIRQALHDRRATVGKHLSYDAEGNRLVLKGVMSEAQRKSFRGIADVAAYREAVDELCSVEKTATGSIWVPLLVLLVALGVPLAVAVRFLGGDLPRFAAGYVPVFLLAAVAFLVEGQVTIRAYGLGYALWALLLGLLVANTVGTPGWLREGARTELFIKTGLVLLGAEILFSKILGLGAKGLFVAWLVTPAVVFFMWKFGTRVLKMTSKPLVIIVAAATSVCGVSAAIATAAACRAKKEDLTLAVGMTLIFTVLMMVLMPLGIAALEMDSAIGAAWMGGTIDSTGAVVAAGAMLGAEAEQIAAVVKMIQNILIGLLAFVVAVLWVTRIEREPGAPRPSAMEIWYRFPKFVIGFVLASIVFSSLVGVSGEGWVTGVLGGVSKPVRYWLFSMAFVSIGLESNFREMAERMAGGKPIWLYVVGQSFNLVLTLFAAWLAFGGVLPL